VIGVTLDEPLLLQLFLAVALRVWQLSLPPSSLFPRPLHASSARFCWARLIETLEGCHSLRLFDNKNDDAEC
jgi:hypothetical protein